MNGILIINKPLNCTSHDVVYKVKKLTNEKVGHTGTLDPMATGVLPLLIGKGTLCAKYLNNHDKKYKATLHLGKRTDTADRGGKILEEIEVPSELFEKSYIEKILKTFIGKIEQTPPIYSAIKVKGKKLYEYARKGQEVKIPTRNVTIYEIELIEINKKQHEIIFQVHCSKGTYIRTLCEDIAKKMGTIGYMSNLERTEVGDFKIENAITIEDLDNIEEYLITIEELFKNNESLQLNEKKLRMFLNGVKLNTTLENGVYRVYNNNRFIGIGIIEDKHLKRDVII